MRIIIFSDTHGDIRNCITAMERIKEVDMIIHLGDILRDVEDLKILYPEIPVEYICGNNDFRNGVPYDKVLEVEGKRIFITHGHLYRVRYEYDTILEKGCQFKADAVLFGHTHTAVEEYKNGVLLLNPGSASLSSSGRESYGIIEIENGKMGACICEVA